MISDGIKMSYPGDEEPKHTFTSKISSPTKRTLNNKNYLAEDVPRFSYTTGLEHDFNDKLRVSPGSQESYGKDGRQFLQSEASSQYFIQNYGAEYKSIPGYRPPPQQLYRGGQNANRTSPSKNSKAANAKPKNVRCKEKKDASMVPFLNKTQKQNILANRYFAPPIDLQKKKMIDGRLRPVIDIAYSSGKNSATYRNYRLSSPLMLSEEEFRVVSKEIESAYRELYCKTQPLCQFGNRNITYGSLQEMTAGLAEYLRNMKMPVAGAGRPLMTGSSWNESFELSFDGKAIDRSDIFRMVDSFSVALSDEEPEEETNRGNLPSSNVLPAEMTSSAF